MSLLPVQLLLDHGADPNQRDGLGNTPLHLGKCRTAQLCVQGGEVSSASLFFLCIVFPVHHGTHPQLEDLQRDSFQSLHPS